MQQNSETKSNKTKTNKTKTGKAIHGIEDFSQRIVEEVKKELGKECQVTIQEVLKNNQVTLLGVVILAKGQNISPTIYLEPFWEYYQKGMPMENIVERIVTVYREDTPKSSINMDFFKEFEKVKDRICYRLINKDTNRELLQKIPHKEYLDLAICFYYAYQNPELGDGTILLYNNHMEMWNTTVEELFLLAKQNTPRLFEWEYFDLNDMVRDMLFEKEEEAFEEREGDVFLESKIPMMVLCNKKRVHGAATLLYEGITQQMEQIMGGSYYILPSSVHELILLKDAGHEDKDTLHKMIEEVNQSQVPPEEILSDSLYYYDAVAKSVRLA